MGLGQTKAEYEAGQAARSQNSQGGYDLVDDGSGRLRETRVTDSHADDCACHFCRRVCCIACYNSGVHSARVWRGLTGFGRHVQSQHPELHGYDKDKSKAKRLVKQLKEVQIAKELKRIERSGFRRVNLKNIRERDLETISNWLKEAKKFSKKNSSADPLFLTALDKAEDKFNTSQKFEAAVRNLTSEISRGVKTGVPVTAQRTTYFDPRLAIEILKLCYATGRGWSFIVHIVSLYGLDALAKELATQGISPPTTLPQIPSPRSLIASGLDLALNEKA